MTTAWWAKQVRSSLDPAGASAARVALERDADQRWQRLRAAAADRWQERRRPSRRRMRTLTLRPGGRFAWRTVPAPTDPGPLAAVVRPLAIATCDMDRPIALGSTPFPTPLAFGHECVAEVLRVGSEVTTVAVGDRVVVPFEISCGACPPCRLGHTANCATVPPLSMYGFGLAGGHWGGAVAEELAVPFADGMLVPLPAGVDPVAAASVADNVGDGYRHVGPHLPELLDRDPDTAVVVVGAVSPRHEFTASVPLYTGLIARALGGRDVTLVDARPDVRERAHALGLTAVSPREGRRLPPAPLVADLSTLGPGLAYALARTAPDGRCSSSGTLHAHVKIPAALMFGRNATLSIARSHARTQIPGVLDLMVAGTLHPEVVTSQVAPLDDAVGALTEHVRAGLDKTILTAPA